MKTTIYDRAWLRVEGCSFKPRPKRGWYYKNMFMGYNAHEAIDNMRKIKGYDDTKQ